ncbi:hypothetical protein LPJ73_007596, partial [Coemansia sp. RSA 2703]
CPDWVEKNKCTKKKCKLPHPSPRKRDNDMESHDGKHSKDALVNMHKRRPLLYMNCDGESADSLDDMSNLAYPINNMEDSSDDDNEDGGDNDSGDDDDLESDLSGDEAEELLKWYDDNYVETED